MADNETERLRHLEEAAAAYWHAVAEDEWLACPARVTATRQALAEALWGEAARPVRCSRCPREAPRMTTVARDGARLCLACAAGLSRKDPT